MIRFNWLIVGILLCAGIPLSAQTKTDPGDEIRTVVISDFQPEIRKHAQKIAATPSIIDTAVQAPAIDYKLAPRKLETHYEVAPIREAKMDGEPLNTLYHGYLKGGGGNYLSAYGEGYYSSTRSKENEWNIHARHLSSSSQIGGTPGFSGYSDDDINLSAKKFIGKHTLDAGIDYSRNSVFFYGDDAGNFSHAKDSIRQYFNYVGAHVGLLSHYPDSTKKINHQIRLNYYYLGDHYKTSESGVELDGEAGYKHQEEFYGLDGSVGYIGDHSLRDTSNETKIHLHPFVEAEGKKWKLKIGLSGFAEFGKESPYYMILPTAEASYDIYKHIITPFVSLSNADVQNTYRLLTTENPFTNPDITGLIRNTRYKYTVSGGLRGSISSYTSYEAHASYSEVSNAAFFVNDTVDPQRNKFTLVYDDGSLLNLHGEIGYQKTEKLRLLVKADYVRYFLQHELQAWHTPTTRLSLSARYNLQNKVILTGDLFAYNEQFARVYQRSAVIPALMQVESKAIQPLVDVNLGVEYRWSRFLSGFLHINNIGAEKYYRWNDYPTQQFNFMLGISFIF
ncbi:MAG TPA: hypothetical protein VNZ86_19465 [Bacteroidia bacterium]|jgi:hypothetical protein|nr:hypothetical protein [Bacteroidia bacterium]